MTITQFNERFGGEWRTLKKSAMFDALISVLDDESPQRKTCSLSLEVMTTCAPATLGIIGGFNSAIDIMKNKMGVDVDTAPEISDFSKTDEQLYIESQESVTMPKMKPRKQKTK